jgi:hypothetical protein
LWSARLFTNTSNSRSSPTFASAMRGTRHTCTPPLASPYARKARILGLNAKACTAVAPLLPLLLPLLLLVSGARTFNKVTIEGIGDKFQRKHNKFSFYFVHSNILLFNAETSDHPSSLDK